jgi:hypothetical protein
MNNINLHTNSFIRIAIGNQEAQFHIMTTDAPKEYDGFGTFCVGEFKKERTMLIRVEHLAWQQGVINQVDTTCEHRTSEMSLSKSSCGHVSRRGRHGKRAHESA